MKNNLFENFTNKYPVSKTLRFELKPIGKTLEHIESKGLVSKDEQRAEKYKKAKKLIDEYHKRFINEALDYVDFYIEKNDRNLLKEFASLYRKKEDLDKIQKELRQTIITCMSKHKEFSSTTKGDSTLFKGKKEDPAKLEELLDILPESFWAESVVTSKEEAQEIISSFSQFTTYFTGFHENRKNMYSTEEQGTAISYRLINENLPMFIDNLRTYEEISKILSIEMNKIQDDFNEVFPELSIENMFTLDYYKHVLTQDGIDRYNSIIGGFSREGREEKIKGLNEYINLYNQNQKDRLPRFKKLYKQILSDRGSISFIPEAFGSDQEVLNAIDHFYGIYNEYIQEPAEGISIVHLFEEIEAYNLDGVFIKNDTGLTRLSKEIYGYWGAIEEAWNQEYDQQYTGKKQSSEKYFDNRSKAFKAYKSFSLSEIETMMSHLDRENQGKLVAYLQNIGKHGNKNFIEHIQEKYHAVQRLLTSTYDSHKNLSQQGNDVEKIKELLDSFKGLQSFLKPLLGAGNEPEKDQRFYGSLQPIWEQLDKVTSLYNKVRNYMTKKPYSNEKFKLNFENSTLLDGWDVNKESDNSCAILEKNGLYYLAIMDKKHKQILKKEFDVNSGYRKMNYKYFPDASKMIPKCSTQTKSVVSHFESTKDDNINIEGKNFIDPLEITREIYSLNNYGYDVEIGTFVKKSKEDKLPKKFQKEYVKQSNDEEGYRDALVKWIDFCKDFLSKYVSTAPFEIDFKHSSEYDSLDEFYKDVICYSIHFTNISEEYIDQLVDEGKLYLFQIYNKDFSDNSRGIPNLHTMYWKALFDPNNLEDVVYKLNGQAEVFFRRASIFTNNQVIHKKGDKKVNKNPDYKSNYDTFVYDIVKDKRFTFDKFQFHVPITMNFKSGEKVRMNDIVNNTLRSASDYHVIGIDRGERHLLYMSVINQQGEIVEQKSLNTINFTINGIPSSFNYHNQLHKKETERDVARKSWDTVENIKELKAGYLSQVVHQITELMVKYNAIVALEDLNFGFKRGRFKVEKQVYQKFEKALIDKLNYLVFKDAKSGEPGHLLSALQLTGKFESFKKLGKQSGVLYYIPAWNTSKIDPTTGFVNMIDTRYTSVEKALDFFQKFDSITYNNREDYFEFSVDYESFTNRSYGRVRNWTVCTYGDRIKTYRSKDEGEWKSESVNITEELKNLFIKYHIEYQEGGNLQSTISDRTEKDFFSNLMYLLKLTLQMRNSKTGTDEDYLISPVKNSHGEFFDSRVEKPGLPKDADANGAYNIARKGLMLIERIQSTGKDEKVDFVITNEDWLKYAQSIKCKQGE